MQYNFLQIEKKWQQFWQENQTFRTEDFSDKPKYYVLDMYPYPSGAGLHVGHIEGYTATDITARYKRMKGFNVMHPIGWDAFGLPAEQFAVKTGKHPKFTTQENIEIMKKQIKSLGFSYDWNREINTTDTKYYRWTQWIFLQLYNKGLAYIADVPVNWCIELGTVLANEEVPEYIEKGFKVERRPMRQWMLKITEYAERLLNDLDELDWPENLKEMQRNWIGKSEGAEIDFSVKGHNSKIRVYTTRPDTLFGATFMVLAPEHELVDDITTKDYGTLVKNYQEKARKRSELERTDLQKDKNGVFTGAYAVNPVTQKEIPIWIADYVIATFGTGAIMCVPCNDDRDYEFATKYELPIVEVIEGGDFVKGGIIQRTNGVLINSTTQDKSFSIDGLEVDEAKKKIAMWLEEKGIGEFKIAYKLRDWLFSRQRYWGEPFPIIFGEDGTHRAVPENELPVLLPEMTDFKPTGKPEPPLSKLTDWVHFEDEDGNTFRRETNTMPQWAGSCWYYLRFLDAQNDLQLCDLGKDKYWMPVDLYIGGAEHAVLHLIYARFWHKVLYDLGFVSTKEPFRKLFNQGMILGYTYRYYRNGSGNKVPFDNVVWRLEENSNRAFTKDTNDELKVHYVISSEVVWKNNKPFHPETDEELETKIDKMSKSLGNTVSPNELILKYGADSLRMYEMFMGPLDQEKPWDDQSIEGVYRFLKKVWSLVIDEEGNVKSLIQIDKQNIELKPLLHKTIKKVTNDIENLRFNTAISQMMILLRELNQQDALSMSFIEIFIKLLSPFAPHISEEIWQKLGHQKSIAYEDWPEFDPALIIDDNVTIVFQINGKLRASMQAEKGLSKDKLEEMALVHPKVLSFINSKEIKRIIVIPDKLVNIVVAKK